MRLSFERPETRKGMLVEVGLVTSIIVLPQIAYGMIDYLNSETNWFFISLISVLGIYVSLATMYRWDKSITEAEANKAFSRGVVLIIVLSIIMTVLIGVMYALGVIAVMAAFFISLMPVAMGANAFMALTYLPNIWYAHQPEPDDEQD